MRDAGVAGVAAAGALSSPAPALGAVRRAGARQTVAVFGGGVAGLTAAHELAERGFDVTVYERRAWGGKARSMDVPGTGTGGRRDLPGEHGFRIVFGIYHNLPDTLKRIPFGSNRNGVFDNMVPGSRWLFTRAGGRSDVLLPVSTRQDPRKYTPYQLVEEVRMALELNLTPQAAAHFAHRMGVFLTSCDARRTGQWENVAWTDFIDADRYPSDYRTLLGELPRFVQASNSDRTSTHWMAGVLEVIVYCLLGIGSSGPFDRPMNAPTNEAWIDPWLALLRGLGVQLELGRALVGFEATGGQITGARVEDASGVRTVRADWYVCALPSERTRGLWSDALLATDPRLAAVDGLPTDWMTGIQFYLRRPRPIIDGHVGYLDSPWALSSISQAQFWERDFARSYGDGTAQDCLSAIVSNWHSPGPVYGKPATELEPSQVAREVWEGMKNHLNDTGRAVLTDDLLHSWHLDPGLVRREGRFHNEDELTVPTIGSFAQRPPTAIGIPNLLLAGDYTSTEWLVGTMEAANKSGRIAANTILERSGSRASPVKVHSWYRPPAWAPFHHIDEQRWRAGRSNLFDRDMPAVERDALMQTLA